MLKDSWTARWEGDVLYISGTTDQFPNDFSTASLERDDVSEFDVAWYTITFARDKEPFCGPDLVGPVDYYELNLPRAIRRLRIHNAGESDYVELVVPQR